MGYGYAYDEEPEVDVASGRVVKHYRRKVTAPGVKLTREEITPLAIMAKQAYDSEKRAEGFDAWRRALVSRVTAGRASGLSTAMRGDFRALEAAFLSEGAEQRQARKAVARPATPASKLRGMLEGELADKGMVWEYLRFIHNGRAMEELGVTELWRCIYSVRNRANARDGKGATKNRNKSQRKGGGV